MKAIGIAELKAKLSRYLKLVRAGREILIEDRGLPIAKLVPLAGQPDKHSRRERLARAGLLKLGPGRVRTELCKPPKGKPLGDGVLAALIEDRREGR